VLLTVLVDLLIPAAFLYFLHWLDLYGSDRPRLVLACVAWGMVAFGLSFVCNRATMYTLDVPRAWIGTHTAPIVEEVFKSLILIYFVRRGRLTYFVDGAIYGFAAGMGFAIIESLRYIHFYPDNPLSLIVLRGFTSTLSHGTATALTGIALGSFTLAASGQRRIFPLLLGWAGAMSLHWAWNMGSYRSPLSQYATEWALAGVGLTGLALVSGAVLLGLRRERARLRHSLGMKVGVSEGEANVVQHMDDLDELLAPLEKRFGKAKCEHVVELLHLEAQLGLKEDAVEEAEDAEARAELAAEVKALRKEINAQRRNVGVYVMLYVRSILPPTDWSLWARLGQKLARNPPTRSTRWEALRGRLGAAAKPGEGLYARISAELEARTRAAALSMQHVQELPETLQQCMDWVMREVHVTVEHVAAGLGHQEAHAHEMLTELADRGFLHRTSKDGQVAFRSRVADDDKSAEKPHIWESATKRKTDSPEGSKQ